MPARGFTLIELLTALLILSLLAVMSFRGLGAVLDARDQVRQETDKWKRVAAFLARFERDIELSAPRPVRAAGGTAPAWLGAPGTGLEFSRFASAEGLDVPRRVGYRLNESHEIEIALWPGLDVSPNAQPARYPVLPGVAEFDVQYLDRAFAWVPAWPTAADDPPLPRAVRLRVLLATGEELVRVFALQS
ncbi:MAG: type II secretion system minor pseudopilin GspJ [Burkholderiales bacterium]